MSRENYELSVLTKDSLEKHVQEIAAAGSYSNSHLYAILAGKETDPFPKFRRLFRAIVQVRPEQARLYLQDLRSLIPSEDKRQKRTTPFSEAMGRITKSYFELLERAGSDDREEVSAALQDLSVKCNRLWNDLNPVGLKPVEAKAS
jgi:hypothetical protein